MLGPHPLYRALVRLYPRTFRHEYGEDLVAHYADLVADRGARRPGPAPPSTSPSPSPATTWSTS